MFMNVNNEIIRKYLHFNIEGTILISISSIVWFMVRTTLSIHDFDLSLSKKVYLILSTMGVLKQINNYQYYFKIHYLINLL